MQTEAEREASRVVQSLYARLAFDDVAVAELAALGEAAVPALEARLQESDWPARRTALMALLRIGSRASVASLLNLAAAERERDATALVLALRGAMAALTPDDAAKTAGFFAGFATHPDPLARAAAADGLKTVRAQQPATLLALAADVEPFVAERARKALEAVSEPTPEGLELLTVAHLLAPSEAVFAAALADTVAHPPAAGDAVALLREAIEKYPAVRTPLVRAVARVAKLSAEAKQVSAALDAEEAARAVAQQAARDAELASLAEPAQSAVSAAPAAAAEVSPDAGPAAEPAVAAGAPPSAASRAILGNGPSFGSPFSTTAPAELPPLTESEQRELLAGVSAPALTPSAAEPALTPSAAEPALTPHAAEPALTPSAAEPALTPHAAEPALTPPAMPPRPQRTARADDGQPIAVENIPEDAPKLLRASPELLRSDLRDLRRMNGENADEGDQE